MNRDLLEIGIRLGGCAHFCILIASAMVPRVLDWRTHLAPLHPFLRRLFWVYGVFIVLTIIGMGAVSLAFAKELSSGGALGRSVCGFIAVFWLARLAVQFFVFDASAFLTTWWLKAGYHLLTIAFIALPVPYALVALAVVSGSSEPVELLSHVARGRIGPYGKARATSISELIRKE